MKKQLEHTSQDYIKIILKTNTKGPRYMLRPIEGLEGKYRQLRLLPFQGCDSSTVISYTERQFFHSPLTFQYSHDLNVEPLKGDAPFR